MIIADSADQPAAAAVEFRGPEQLAGRALVRQLGRLAGLVSPGIAKPIGLSRGHREAGLGHPERREDMLLQILAEPHAAEALDRDAQHICRHRVVPPSPRLELQGQLRKMREIFVAGVMLAAEVELDLAIGGVDTGAVLEAVGEARLVRQQIDEA